MNEKEMKWLPDLGNGSFQNPILFADYSDPDVIRVDDTYYMTASSFNYTPGLPILISKDLVNWQLVNYALNEIPEKRYDVPVHAGGIWAPAIRYHQGLFYIYYGMPDEGIYMVRTKDPLKSWEAPVLVLAGKGLIDPCPLWDHDGSAYVVHGYAKSRIGFKSFLGVFPLSPDGTKAIGEDHLCYRGVETQPTIEGPKVYQRDGYYYIFAPAGGVKEGWQTVLRSRSITGPYEERIVMTQGETVINGPHQGGLTDTITGEEWFVHFQDRGLYGRIVHLQPVIWRDGWPIIGVEQGHSGVGNPCLVHQKPDTGITSERQYLTASDDFSTAVLDLKWQWMGNGKREFYDLSEVLRLFCLNKTGDSQPTIWKSPNVLTQKLIYPAFVAEIKLQLRGLKPHNRAGVLMIGGQYTALAVDCREENKVLVQLESSGEGMTRSEQVIDLEQIPLSVEAVWFRLHLQVQNQMPVFLMEYRFDQTQFCVVATDFLPSDHTWVGAKLGLFALTQTTGDPDGYADFEYIQVIPEALELCQV